MMKKKLLLIKLILLAFIGINNVSIASIHLNNYYSYSPDGKQHFKLSEEQILIKFVSGVSFQEQANLLNNESLLQPLTKEMLLPSPQVTIAKTNGFVGEEKLRALLNRLQQSNLVEYANPFLVYKDGSKQGITDKFIVKLNQQSDRALLNQMVSDNGIQIVENYKYDNKVFIIQVPKNVGINALEMANKFYESGKFASAEPDFLLLLKKFNTNDPFLNYQWSLNNTGSSIQYSGTVGCDMKVFNAWGISTGSTNIKVAIIDEGVDLVHPDLQANLLTGYDATGLGSGGAPSGNDAHGTACAGIVAGVGNNSTGIAGVAYNCKIIPVRIAYSDANDNWVTSNASIGTAIDWAWQTAGADVLSNSWGGGSSSSLINDAITRAVTQGRGGLGAPVIFAAGNDNGAVSYPATLTNVIAVTAMSMCNQRKSTTSCDGETFWGSNYGTNTDISAPGVKIYTCDISGTSGYSTGNYTATFNGTSSACPNAAGVMALILSVNPNLTMASARQIIETTCDKVGGYTYSTNVSGQPNGTWSNDLGYGRVNAFAALQLANPIVCTSPPPVGVAAATPNSICSTTNVSLSLSGVSVGSGQTYQWQSSPNNSTWSNISGASTTSFNVSVSTATYFRCQVTCSGITTNSSSVLVNFNNNAISIYPHVQNFDATSSLPCGWTVQNVNGDANTWGIGTFNPRSGANNVTYAFNANAAADDWLFTPQLSMNAGSTYRVRFWYRVRNATYPERLEIKWGNSPTALAMTSTAIFSNTNLTNITYTEGVTTIIAPSTSGNYHVGFRVFSAADMYDLNIDDVTIELVSVGCTTPTIGGTASIISPIESGSSTTLSLTGYNGTSIQWEQSSDAGTTWNAISGATSANYSGVYYLGNYQFRARVSRVSCTDAFSNVVSLTVNPKTGDNFNLPIVINTPTFTGNYDNGATSGYTNQFNGQISADIYFKVATGACTDSLSISTCGSSMDTYLSLLDAAGTLIDFEDDNGPFCSGTPSSMKVAVSPNTTYYIVAEGYSNITGLFNININQIDNPLLTANITAGGPTTFCAGGSVVLTSSSSTGNVWSNGATTQSITVSTSGNYGVTVTNASGCSATSNAISVSVNNLPSTPTITAGGATTFCAGGSIVLTSSSSTGNVWSNGATTQSIIVSASGSYSVTVTNGNGCSATSNSITVNVIALPSTPTISAGGATTFCAGGSVVLTSSSLTGNVWSNGATTQSITVSTSGNYSVTVTNGNGCLAISNSIAVNVIALPSTPTINAGGATTFCAGGSVVLTSSSLTGNVWSNGATTQSIIVSTSGNYDVTVTNGNGCVSVSNNIQVVVTPSVMPSLVVSTVSSTVCQGSTVLFTATPVNGGSAPLYQWKVNGINVGSNSNNFSTSTLINSDIVTCVLTSSATCASPSNAVSNALTMIVNNCTGVPTTKLRTADCGKQNLALNSSILCDVVAGATNYDFEFTNITTNTVGVKTTTANSVGLSTISPAIQFGTQYQVRVRAKVGGVYGNYGSICVIGTVCNPNICGVPSTQLRTSDCGKLNFSPLTGQIIADAVAAASQYEFEFRNISTNALYATKLQTSNVLALNTITPSLLWNTQYNVKVRAYIAGVAGNYGNNCIIGLIPDPSVNGVPNTQLATASCGAVNLALTGSISCVAVTGAGSYEWEFKNQSNTSVVATKTTTSTSLNLSTVTGLQWNTQYNVRVRAYIGTVAGTYNVSCLIGIIPDPALNGVPSTKIRTSDCGKLNFGLGGFAVADLVSGAAEYEFEIRNNTTNAFIANKIQTSNVLTFSTVPALTWGNQYKISVRARISTTWGTFGTACTIGFICNPSICGVPSTTLRTTDCGKVNFNLSTGFMVANTVAGATLYEFEITDILTNTILGVQTSATMNLYFNAIAPALQSNKQYSIRVRATISGVVGNYGSACTIGFTNGSRSEIESNYSLDETINNNGFKLNVYPNPFNDKLNLIIQTQITEKAQIQIFDMMGNLILQTQINSNENMSFGNELAAGNYMIRVIAENGAQEIRSVIKSN
jgi:subtilisin family serine protease